MALSPEFYKSLIQMTNELSINPEHLLLIMTMESGLNPNTPPNAYGAEGLVQFMRPTLRAYKYDPKNHQGRRFNQLSGEEQIPYIKKHLQQLIQYNGGPFKTVTQMYIGNFWPAALKKAGVKSLNPNTVIVEKNPKQQNYKGVSQKFEDAAYDANKGLDRDKDLKITYKDLDDMLESKKKDPRYIAAVNEVRKYSNQPIQQPQQPQQQTNNYMDKRIVEAPKQKSFLDILGDYLKQIFANHQKTFNLHKTALVKNSLRITVVNNNKYASVFAEELSKYLDDNLFTDSSILNKNGSICIDLNLYGKKDIYRDINTIIKNVKEDFEDRASQKITLYVDKDIRND